MTPPATAPVLDLRPFSTFQTHVLGELTVDAPTVSGTVHGYTAEAQRKSVNDRSAVCLRLSAPDGRVLNLAAPVYASRMTLVGLVGMTLSPWLSSVVTGRGPAGTREADAATAAERALTEGLACLVEGVHGTPALVRVASAAEGVNPEKVLTYDPFIAIGRGASRIEEGDLHVPKVAMLIRHRFSRTAAKDWFGESLRVRSEAEVKAMARFRANGWSARQVQAVTAVERARAARTRPTGGRPARARDRDVWGWAVLSWEQAWIAMRAGLTATTARRLLRTGEWDEQALTTLGGLRHPNPDEARLLDLAR